ncbi:hypothetical protein NECID01_0043 [Nematocida sp. AWRm77]|nr:hypothetical protein NECID01_0043 [Nematocida sp. AWRm77]
MHIKSVNRTILKYLIVTLIITSLFHNCRSGINLKEEELFSIKGASAVIEEDESLEEESSRDILLYRGQFLSRNNLPEESQWLLGEEDLCSEAGIPDLELDEAPIYEDERLSPRIVEQRFVSEAELLRLMIINEYLSSEQEVPYMELDEESSSEQEVPYMELDEYSSSEEEVPYMELDEESSSEEEVSSSRLQKKNQ